MYKVKVGKSALFKEYLLWLDPLLQLTQVERNILASIITLHYAHRDYNEETLNSLLFSEETLTVIRKKLRLGVKAFNEGIKGLRTKGFLLENAIAPKFINYPKDGKFKIEIEFEVI